VYCLEQLDQPAGVPLYDVSLDLRTKDASRFQEEFQPNLLGGMTVLRHVGAAKQQSASGGKLYYRYTSNPVPTRDVELQLIPYYAWANRAATPMQVWTPCLRA
jgi:DUF1680 family protein